MDRDFFLYIRELKNRYGLKIIESHVHPYDVIGVVHYADYTEVAPGEFVFKKFERRRKPQNRPDLMGWLGRSDFNKYAFSLFNLALRAIPGYENYDLQNAFGRTGVNRLLTEMDGSLVDEAVLLPVEPWLPAEHVQKVFSHQRLMLLGSVDIQRIRLREIRDTINHFVNDYGIIGLKLHPNMQDFLPQPSHNPQDVKEKMQMIYRTADDLGLYLLFHGGPSGLARNLDEKYGGQIQKSRNGLLENYCDKSGNSELFGRYRIPIVIAHLGHFGAPQLNTLLIRTILDKYDNVYFDTAGSPSRFIRKVIEWGGSEKILLGSDALYFRIKHSVYSVYKAVQNAQTCDDRDAIMVNILGRNFQQRLLKGKIHEQTANPSNE